MHKEALEDLLQKNGYPLYVYDEERIHKQISKLRMPDFDLLYSMKCNPNAEILRYMHSQGVGIDAASAGEVMAGVDAGFTPNQIFFSSPGKRRCDIEDTLGKCMIIADSITEIALINDICRAKGIQTEIGVRINPVNEGMHGHTGEVMSGASSKFGVDYELLRSQIEELHKLPYCKITGVHIYFGSQICDERTIYDNMTLIAKTCRELQRHFPLRFIDFGGGFGVRIIEGEREPDIKKLSALLSENEDIRQLRADGVRLMVESGRFLVSEAGKYVTRIVDIKESVGEKYLIIYGGMNGFFRPVFMDITHEISVLGGTDGKTERVNIVGNTCTPIDILAKNIELPLAKIGDIVTISHAGAYGYTMSLTDFISHDKPKEIYVKKDDTLC